MITEKDKKEAEDFCNQTGKDGKQFPQTMDAVAWAKEWLRLIELDPSIAKDEGTMIGWFANAIMAGYDEAQRRGFDLQLERQNAYRLLHELADGWQQRIAVARAELEKAKNIDAGGGDYDILVSARIDAALKALS